MPVPSLSAVDARTDCEQGGTDRRPGPRHGHSMLCRLTFPLCYNFTFLVDITGTVFQSVRADGAVAGRGYGQNAHRVRYGRGG